MQVMPQAGHSSYYTHPISEYYWINWQDNPKQVETQNRAYRGVYPQLTLANGLTLAVQNIQLVPAVQQHGYPAGTVVKHHWATQKLIVPACD